MAKQSVTVDVVSDVVCPWCFIGQKRLDKAIELLPDIDVHVRWRPFQLDPTIPAGGIDRKQYMLSKFGSEERLKEIHARVEQLGADEGIEFDFDAITVSPNTIDAHRVIRWSAAQGEAAQNTVARRLFQLYFEEGKNVGDHEVLIDAVRGAGLDAAPIEVLLATDADRTEISTEAATASQMGITGVPCFLLESKYAVMGAQDVATLADAIQQVATAKANGDLGDA
ncbi:DsbA family oxidoreductase [Mesorhizobium sp. SB112]|uniref:DsbA family oxidoreductase n=1 Tax=Mesorhizobium sp. SB112 TaxID=3151853 RepID=UPI0032640152